MLSYPAAFTFDYGRLSESVQEGGFPVVNVSDQRDDGRLGNHLTDVGPGLANGVKAFLFLRLQNSGKIQSLNAHAQPKMKGLITNIIRLFPSEDGKGMIVFTVYFRITFARASVRGLATMTNLHPALRPILEKTLASMGALSLRGASTSDMENRSLTS